MSATTQNARKDTTNVDTIDITITQNRRLTGSEYRAFTQHLLARLEAVGDERAAVPVVAELYERSITLRRATDRNAKQKAEDAKQGLRRALAADGMDLAAWYEAYRDVEHGLASDAVRSELRKASDLAESLAVAAAAKAVGSIVEGLKAVTAEIDAKVAKLLPQLAGITSAEDAMEAGSKAAGAWSTYRQCLAQHEAVQAVPWLLQEHGLLPFVDAHTQSRVPGVDAFTIPYTLLTAAQWCSDPVVGERHAAGEDRLLRVLEEGAHVVCATASEQAQALAAPVTAMWVSAHRVELIDRKRRMATGTGGEVPDGPVAA